MITLSRSDILDKFSSIGPERPSIFCRNFFNFSNDIICLKNAKIPITHAFLFRAPFSLEVKTFYAKFALAIQDLLEEDSVACIWPLSCYSNVSLLLEKLNLFNPWWFSIFRLWISVLLDHPFKMPLRLDVKRKLLARSDRIKSTDLHPQEPWMLVSLYNGNVHIWNYETQQLVKSFEVCDLPVRAAKFVMRKSWIITGSDDMHVRVYNYNTLERVHQFEAHSDYLRSIAVHPTHPYVLTSSDDMLIK